MEIVKFRVYATMHRYLGLKSINGLCNLFMYTLFCYKYTTVDANLWPLYTSVHNANMCAFIHMLTYAFKGIR